MTGTDAGTADNWTTRRLLAWMGETFTKRGIDSPRLMAEMLMAHVAGVDRLKLYTDPDRPATPIERDRLRDLVKRAMGHEPIQYLVGEGWFFGLPFRVDKRVLVPRPSTETLVEHVLQHARATHGVAPSATAGRRGQSGGGMVPLGQSAAAATPGGGEAAADASGDAPGTGLLIADVCTGSGCIGVTLARHMRGVRVLASDVSADALDIARENAERHGVAERMEFLQGDLLSAFDGHPAVRAGSLHYIVSNPPYIPDHEWAAVERNVKDHEPTGALRAKDNGLEFIRPLIEHAPPLLSPDGLLLIEHAASHADEVRALAERHPLLANARTLKDGEGFPRVLVAERAGA